MRKSILSTDIKIIPFPISGSEDQKQKRNIELNILLDWIQSTPSKTLFPFFNENKLSTSSLKIRFKNSNLEEIDFIFYLKSPEKETYILIEVEKSWFSSNKEIRDSIAFKRRKMSYFVDLINFKNQSIKDSFEIKDVVIIKKGDQFFYNDESIKIFEDININNIVWSPEKIRTKLLALYNKSVPINLSANNIFENEYEIYDVVKERLSRIMFDLLNNSQGQHVTKINGNPGSGKTLIALLLYKELIDNAKNVGLYFLSPNTIKDFFWNQKTQKYQENIAAGDFESANFDWKKFSEFDYIIVDEQQRLFKNQSKQFFKLLKKNCQVILIGDDNQRSNPLEQGFKIPKNIHLESIFMDSTFLRYSKSHLNFLDDLILKGKLLQKVYHSELKFQFILTNDNSDKITGRITKVDENLLTKTFEPYSDNNKQIEPSSFMGEECDVVVFDLSRLEVEYSSKVEIKFKSRYAKSDLSKSDLEINDKLTKQGIYCGLTRATQRIIILGNEEMKVYFQHAFNLLRK
ncbi:MAG: DNA/RNA helicase domain-containing protein [Metamycoplasmataceae bacterium]